MGEEQLANCRQLMGKKAWLRRDREATKLAEVEAGATGRFEFELEMDRAGAHLKTLDRQLGRPRLPAPARDRGNSLQWEDPGIPQNNAERARQDSNL